MKMLSELVLIALSICLARGHLSFQPIANVDVSIRENQNRGFDLEILQDNVSRYKSVIGRSMDGEFDTGADSMLLNFTSLNTQLKLSANKDGDVFILNLKWTSPNDVKLEDCVDLGSHQWFGGPLQTNQRWPIQKTVLKDYVYVTKAESSIIEPYWLNSIGTFIYVQKTAPLFVDQNNALPNHLCFVSEIKPPYSSSRPYNELTYDIVLTDDARSGHEYAVKTHLGKPKQRPNFRMIDRPIFTTWPRYSDAINQTVVMHLARQIVEHGFKKAIIELDDYWEKCPGSLQIDTNKYPDFKRMISDIKEMGLTLFLWIHPFVYYQCEPWINQTINDGYLITSEDGEVFTSISNSEILETHVDFTNTEAKTWWINRVKSLQRDYDLEGMKFCCGEAMYTIQISRLTGDIRSHPNLITSSYVRSVASLDWDVLIKPGYGTQDLSLFNYMGDKDFTWNENNGLPTIITTLFQNNFNGYPFIIANMINGNDYINSKELYIRWIQACTFIPNLQIAFPPWEFDNQTFEIVQKYLDLHSKYEPAFKSAIDDAVSKGSPVNSPIWWIDPTNDEALKIWDEYLLGEDILVAPILTESTTKRDVYLPKGQWKYQETDQIYEGQTWIKDLIAEIDTLPYFKKI